MMIRVKALLALIGSMIRERTPRGSFGGPLVGIIGEETSQASRDFEARVGDLLLKQESRWFHYVTL